MMLSMNAMINTWKGWFVVGRFPKLLRISRQRGYYAIHKLKHYPDWSVEFIKFLPQRATFHEDAFARMLGKLKKRKGQMMLQFYGTSAVCMT